MAKVIGSTLRATDEMMHAPSADPAFSENMLFTFFGDSGAPGGFVRTGNRVNEGIAEVTFCLFLPDGRLLFRFQRAPLGDRTVFNAGGMKFDVLEPTELVRTVFDGEAFLLSDPGQLADTKRAFSTTPIPIRFEATHSAASSMFMTPYPNHYEQHMLTTGTLTYGDSVLDVRAKGVRDHTWGPRNWQPPQSTSSDAKEVGMCDRTLWCTFEPGYGFSMSLTWHDEESDPEVIGGIATFDGFTPIVRARLASKYGPDDLTHEGFELEVDLEDGRSLEITGTTEAVAPLRNRRGRTTYIGQGLTRYVCAGRSAYGLSEYMDLLKDGQRSLHVD